MKNLIIGIIGLFVIATTSCTPDATPTPTVSVEKGMYVPSAGGIVTLIDSTAGGFWVAYPDHQFLAQGQAIVQESSAFYTYDEAVNFVDTLNNFGHDDWQLPDSLVLNCINYDIANDPTPNATGQEVWTKYAHRTLHCRDCGLYGYYVGQIGLQTKNQVCPVRFQTF